MRSKRHIAMKMEAVLKHSVITPAQETFTKLYASHIQEPGRVSLRTVLGSSTHSPKLVTTMATVGSKDSQFSQVAIQHPAETIENR